MSWEIPPFKYTNSYGEIPIHAEPIQKRDKGPSGLIFDRYDTSEVTAAAPTATAMYYKVDGALYLLGFLYEITDGYDGRKFVEKIQKRYGKASGHNNYPSDGRRSAYWIRDGRASKIELSSTVDAGKLLLGMQEARVVYTNTEIEAAFNNHANAKRAAKNKRLQSAF